MSCEIPSATANAVLRALGMLQQQAGMYGVSHKATQAALEDAISLLGKTLSLHGRLEFAKTSTGLLVNGEPLPAPDSSGAFFMQRLSAHKASVIVFKPGVSAADLATFMKCYTKQPMTMESAGGISAVLAKEIPGGRIAIENTEYRKVGVDDEDAKSAPRPSYRPQGGLPATMDLGTATLNLSDGDASGALDFEQAEFPRERPAPKEPVDQTPILQRARMQREANARMMSAMLRHTADLLDNTGELPDDFVQKEVLTSIERTLQLVEANAHEVKHRITKLAAQVAEDRETIESIEANARRSGIGFNLTRQQLIEHFAELNQEILQPLTVSSGVIDLISSGKTGALNDEQKELLQLAVDSMDRMRQLIEYTARIAGLPDGLTPDAKIQRDSYRV